MIRTEFAVVLLVASLAMLGALWRLHTGHNRYSLAQLVAEPDESRLSLSRLGQLVALLVSSWGYVWLTLNDRLTEWYFGTYMVAWAGTYLTAKALAGRQSVPPAES